MLQIIPANESDFDNLELIGKDSLPIYYSSSDLKMLKMTNHIILKVKKNNNIIGFVVSRETDSNIHILSIAVDKSERNNGVGSKIIDNIKLKNKSISLFVHTINKVALTFYKKNQFIISDILFGYYDVFEKEKDAYKMVFKL